MSVLGWDLGHRRQNFLRNTFLWYKISVINMQMFAVLMFYYFVVAKEVEL